MNRPSRTTTEADESTDMWMCDRLGDDRPSASDLAVDAAEEMRRESQALEDWRRGR